MCLLASRDACGWDFFMFLKEVEIFFHNLYGSCSIKK